MKFPGGATHRRGIKKGGRGPAKRSLSESRDAACSAGPPPPRRPIEMRVPPDFVKTDQTRCGNCDFHEDHSYTVSMRRTELHLCHVVPGCVPVRLDGWCPQFRQNT